jgi:hypothetical protein
MDIDRDVDVDIDVDGFFFLFIVKTLYIGGCTEQGMVQLMAENSRGLMVNKYQIKFRLFICSFVHLFI